ncbi:hypothetical protein [Inhella proteolytica]|nr:hypothetical protein [Inhella proteolytica]
MILLRTNENDKIKTLMTPIVLLDIANSASARYTYGPWVPVAKRDF